MIYPDTKIIFIPTYHGNREIAEKIRGYLEANATDQDLILIEEDADISSDQIRRVEIAEYRGRAAVEGFDKPSVTAAIRKYYPLYKDLSKNVVAEILRSTIVAFFPDRQDHLMEVIDKKSPLHGRLFVIPGNYHTDLTAPEPFASEAKRLLDTVGKKAKYQIIDSCLLTKNN